MFSSKRLDLTLLRLSVECNLNISAALRYIFHSGMHCDAVINAIT